MYALLKCGWAIDAEALVECLLPSLEDPQKEVALASVETCAVLNSIDVEIDVVAMYTFIMNFLYNFLITKKKIVAYKTIQFLKYFPNITC